jgi:hypothetical protein
MPGLKSQAFCAKAVVAMAAKAAAVMKVFVRVSSKLLEESIPFRRARSY